MKAPPRTSICCITVIASLLAIPSFAQDKTAAPDIARRATDDLAAYYGNDGTPPPYAKAISDLQDPFQAARATAGKYLLALLEQARADEISGRAPQKSLPFWGGGVENTAVELRKQIAQKFAGAEGNDDGLDAAQWLIEKDEILENQLDGFKFVASTKTLRANDIIRSLLATPHHNPAVLVAAINEAAARKLDVAPDIKKLAVWYRKAVRDAARDAAEKLGIKNLPEFKPEDAFNPWLDGEMKAIAAMPYPEIPKDAKWMRFAQAKDANEGSKTISFGGGMVTEIKDGKLEVKQVDAPKAQPGISGWLLEEKDGKLKVMDYFGFVLDLDKKEADPKSRTFAEDAAVFADARKLPADSPEDMTKVMAVLSMRGMLTGQFEPRYISIPEALVAAWSYKAGDKKLAAEIILPRIEASPDDLEFAHQIAELLGKVYQQQMLDAFCEARDYDTALRIANHLAEPEFDTYFYQPRAKELAAQLQKRAGDFKTFTLPSADDWAKQKAGMSREEQIKFLADHLRLLNCAQWGQPGDVSYDQAQVSGAMGAQDRKPVINPFNELRDMNLTGAELTLLAPYLEDDDFMPTYSYWRDFHPARHLHRVYWAVQAIVNEAAGSNIAQLQDGLPPEQKKAAVEKVLAWCKENGSKSREQRILDTLATTAKWDEFARTASLAETGKIAAAAPVMEKRLDDFPSNSGDILEICYRLDTPDALPFARDWLTAHAKVPDGAWTDDDSVRFWCAMMELRASQPQKPEGLDVLKALLAKNNAGQWYPFAFDLLMSAKTQDATDIAAGALKKENSEGFNPEMAKQLFLAGRQEALDYMLAWLANNGDGGTSSTWTSSDPSGNKTVHLESGDNAATAIAGWRTDNYQFDQFRPVEQRRADREKLAQWLKDQFALVQAGQKTAISPPGHVDGSHPTLDAP
ncbi:MAG TPA: hypothetical protein VG733_03220 [Chthoniobacteraceae bacterium]|nr:hypothetical protein [Chthoniobacteraceae bacterium]